MTHARRAADRVILIVPDSHGAHADAPAVAAMIADVRKLRITHCVLLGDHLDCGGTFSVHQRTYTNELAETYEDDCAAGNALLDALQEAAPRAEFHYLEGNHEQRVERWATQSFAHKRDADMLVDRFGPEAVLSLKRRGIKYYRRQTHYQGISIPGTIRIGKCHFTHGIGHSSNAAQDHLRRFSANVVFGHVHRPQSVIGRTVSQDSIGAWCPGTLTKLQPLYAHTRPSDWAHGYALQFHAPGGAFLHCHVPIANGRSLWSATPRHI